MSEEFPILDFDASRKALIEPSKVLRKRDVPERCVICFFWSEVEKLKETRHLEALPFIKSEMPAIPVYRLTMGDSGMAVVCGAVGAPLCAAVMEELIARGARKFIVCGGAGVLDSNIDCGHIVVPTSAIRDEGTSYHYLPPGLEVGPSPEVLDTIFEALEEQKIPHVTGKTWTTDAVYRETPKIIAKRREQGCVTVEMEAAALFAVAQFRGVQIGQLLYGGDDVGGEVWDNRNWHNTSVRGKLLHLAIEICGRI